MEKGVFIVFDGPEGTGKTTQIKRISDWLLGIGLKVKITKEPGSTLIGTKIREVLLSVEHKKMDCMTELLLFNADRVQHLSETILPYMNMGYIVLSDRFNMSTMAYQGYGRGLSLEKIKELNSFSIGEFKPDLTLIFDIDPEKGLSRKKSQGEENRMEAEELNFHNRVRKGFLTMAENSPEDITVIKTDELSIDEVGDRIRQAFLIKFPQIQQAQKAHNENPLSELIRR